EAVAVEVLLVLGHGAVAIVVEAVARLVARADLGVVADEPGVLGGIEARRPGGEAVGGRHVAGGDLAALALADGGVPAGVVGDQVGIEVLAVGGVDAAVAVVVLRVVGVARLDGGLRGVVAARGVVGLVDGIGVEGVGL